ncbi:hypothetical protein WUBG_09914 [Wuchereria bancrofti]|uniref:Uncharacterized protein n=1 Tax=Wuchereria bancrofti TaxID=6293 RepID=J9AX67_WUCBA|nr:hypothetical protein WUBG_09914 [Wuchereria bancrofti]
MLEGRRIHVSRKYKQDGFCARCGQNLLQLPEFTTAQRAAAMKFYAFDWYQRVCSAVIDERRIKPT